MAVTAEQQSFLSTNWQERHEKNGKTALAARMALAQYDQIETDHFQNSEVATWHDEVARQAAVLARAAALLQQDVTVASDYLREAARVVTAAYPIGPTEDEAIRRSAFWEDVYGEQNAMLICLRDLVGITETIWNLTRDEKALNMHSQVLKLLQELSGDQTQLYASITAIERAPYGIAKDRYHEYLQTKDSDPGRALTVTARFLGRAAAAKDVRLSVVSSLHMVGTVLRHPSLLSFALREFGKNVPAGMKTQRTYRRYDQWHSQLKKGKESLLELPTVHALTANTWIATAVGRAHHLEEV